jgi:predicted ArsR family transcriptional regulator
MTFDRTDDELAALAPLAEPVRRRLYLWVVGSEEPVGRDEAAAAAGISRSLAAFHLDRLVDDGLLEPVFRRRTGRTGPGAGRPAKLYRRAPETHAVSLPARNYELAAELFAEALDADAGSGPDAVRGTVETEAHERGAAIGAARLARGASLRETLAGEGYEPRSDGDVIRLGNCPFHALVQAHRDLTCGMNLSLMTGILDGLETPDWHARLDPRPGLCCVCFEPESASADEPVPTAATS